ncbi:peptidase S8/S53 domain-containing protein, partial [Blakeslea trispora]
MLSKRRLFYDQLEQHNINYDIRHEYEVINAVSVSFKSAQDASLFFEKVRGVKKAWPVNAISKPRYLLTNNNTTPIDITTNLKDQVSSLFTIYNTTGVKRVRDELGIRGSSIKVAIIDTGIDYMHPGLGGCFGKGCRVAYGYDFVGDAYTGENFPIPDEDPRDTCNGHGTHVAGIIGANDMLFTGVAPDVTFGAYRIFGCKGGSADDIIMKAMERAYLDGMDVVNLSLGDLGWPESPTSLLADELSLKGMIVVAAAGNEGDKGMFEVGTPSIGKHALSIASIDNTNVLSHTFTLDNVTIVYTTPQGNIFNLTSAELALTSSTFAPQSDACQPLPVDLKNKVAIVSRGGCTFMEKILNTQKAGALAVLIYNNEVGPLNPSAFNDGIHIDYGGISKQDGQLLFQSLASTNRSATFQKHDVSFPVPTAGLISEFSSWGLAPDLSLKPDLSAPGGHIYSTYPTSLGSYATLSGTSMASPFVAGVIALMLESRGGSKSINITDVRHMLLNNGKPFEVFGTENQLNSVARQGAGLVDVYHAIASDTAVVPEQIKLSDLDHMASNNEYTLTIKNNGRMMSEYKVGYMSAVMVQAYQPQTLVEQKMQAQANIEIIGSEIIEIHANHEKNVTIRIQPPINSSTLPPSVYSGYITVTKLTNSADVKYIPYAGLTNRLSQMPVLLVNRTMPNLIASHVSSITPAFLSMQLLESSPIISISIVNATNVSHNLGLVPGGYARYLSKSDVFNPADFLLLPWYGNVVSSTEQAALGALSHRGGMTNTAGSELYQDIRKLERSSDRIFGIEQLAIGKSLPPGTYKFKVMALRPLGDPNKEQDYDIWYSPDVIKD